MVKQSVMEEQATYYYGDVEALDELELARIRSEAERGYAKAQYALGLVLARRDGVKHGDWAEAIKWYKLAAEAGYAAAQHEMGVLCALGTGMEKDAKVAVEWYHKAAVQGNAMSQFELARRIRLE